MEPYFGRETGATSIYRWVADELVVNVGGKNYWLFNVMDSKTSFALAAYISPVRTARAAATALSLTRERAENHPAEIKTEGLRSYRNMSERLRVTFRDRDKTLWGLKRRETGQAYVDGLVTHYNFFRSHESRDGKRPAEAAGAALPFRDWAEVAGMQSDGLP